jgi:hypothetical protein
MFCLIILLQLNTVFGYFEKRDMAAISHPLALGPSMNPLTRARSRFTPTRNLRADRVYRLRRYILKKAGIFSEHLARFKISKVLKRVKNWPKYVPLKDPELLSDDELYLLEKSLHESDQMSLINSINEAKTSEILDYDHDERSQKLGTPENYLNYLHPGSEMDHPLAVWEDDSSDFSSEDYIDGFVPLENDDKSQDSRDDFDLVGRADDIRSDRYIRDFNPFEEFDVKPNDLKDSDSHFFNDDMFFENSDTMLGHNEKQSFAPTQKIGNGDLTSLGMF